MSTPPPPAASPDLDARKRQLLAALMKEQGIDPLKAPILPLERDRPFYPQSFEQERLWVLDQIEPGSAAYNLPSSLLLLGPLRRDVMEWTFTEVLRRHLVLRTTYGAGPGGEAVQAVQPLEPVRIPVVDLTSLPPERRELEHQRLAFAEAVRPFDLARGPVLRLHFFRLSPASPASPETGRKEEHVLLLNVHHIASDGWSNGVLMREVTELYPAFLAGRPSPLPELPVQYVDFAHWQRKALSGPTLEKALGFWRGRLADSRVLELPGDRPRPAVQGLAGAVELLEVPREALPALRELARGEGATLFMLFTAAFELLLARWSGQDDFNVGTPVTNRPRTELEGLIGFFVNTVVLRADLAGEPTFRELLGRVRKTVLESFAHQQLPFSKVVEAVNPERSLAHTPLFQVIVGLGSAATFGLEAHDPDAPADLPPPDPGALEFLTLGAERDAAMFDLNLSLVDAGGSIHGSLEYRTELFDRPTVRRLLGHFGELLRHAAANPDRRIAEIQLLTGPERAQILQEWTDTARDWPEGPCLHDLVAEQAERTPEAPAVEHGGLTLAYRELLDRSRRLAAHLQTLGVGPEVRVGVCLRRDLDLPVALLGVLQAGGAYVPLDANYPPDRLRLLLEDSGAAVLITREDLLDRLPETQTPRLFLENGGLRVPPPRAGGGWTWGEVRRGGGPLIEEGAAARLIEPTPLLASPHTHPASRPGGRDASPTGVPGEGGGAAPEGQDFGSPGFQPRADGGSSPSPSPTNLAYLIYTSGSTGRPKAVAIEHRSAVALVRWAAETYSSDDLRAVLASTSINFDMSVFEVFATLSLGGRMVLVEDALRLTDLESPADLSFLNTVPSAAAELVRAKALPASLRVVGLGGEPLPRRLVDAVHAQVPGAAVWNFYGPSEDTTYSTVSRYDAGFAGPVHPVHIGRPLSGSRVYLLDPAGQPVPVGVPGELFLAGDGLARGYLGRPEMTAERFVPDPFGRPGSRLYRTGDLARWRTSGELDYLGRRDFQVKIRGFRVELGEVETVLATHPGLRECAVLALEQGGVQRLAAFVVPADDDGPSADAASLKTWLRARLPEHMVPTAWVTLAALPLNPNGKVDRRALARQASPASPAPAAAAAYAAPRDPVEEEVAGIWAEVLGAERPVGVHDNFFDLGGHSLLATRVVTRLREVFGAGLDLPIRALFEAPTVAELARRIEAAGDRLGRSGRFEIADLEPRRRGEDRFPLSFSQERLWLIDQIEPGSPAYNMPTALRLLAPASPGLLARVLTEIVRRHEILRTTYSADSGRPVQVVHPVSHPAGAVPVPVVDLTGLPAALREPEARRLADEEAATSFDLERGPVLRARLLRLSPSGTGDAFLLTMHHIASDGWSVGVLTAEVAALYAPFSQGEPSPLPELPLQYADFARWQRRAFDAEALAASLDFWRTKLDGLPVLELPADRPRPPVQGLAGAAEPVVVRADIAAAQRGRGTTLFMAVTAAFQALLAHWSRQTDFAVGTPVAGRDRAELEPLIGFFVNTLVLRADLAGDPTFAEILARVREEALEAFAHQEVPFEKLVEELNPERSLAHSPIFQVLVALQNAGGPGGPMGAAGGLALEPFGVTVQTAKFDLSLALSEVDGGLTGILEYRTDLFEPATVRRLAGYFSELLAAAVADPGRRLSELLRIPESERSQVLDPRAGGRVLRVQPRGGAGPAVGEDAPRTPAERRLAAIWAEVLGLEQVGIHDNFFDLGGHSLLATQLVSRAREAFQVKVPQRAVFEAPTVAGLAGQIVAMLPEEEDRTFKDIRDGRDERTGEWEAPLSFAQQRLWFLDRLEPGSPLYNLFVGVPVGPGSSPAVLAACFAEIVRRHESLRTTFAERDGEPVQVIRAPEPLPLPVIDLAGLPPAAQAAETGRLAAAEAALPFDLARGPLLRVRLVLHQDGGLLLGAMHHIISDGWSLGVFRRELEALYPAFAAGRPSPLPELPAQYPDFAAWQRRRLSGERLEIEIDHWRQRLAGIPAVLELPLDRPRPAVRTFRGADVPVAVPAGVARGVAALAQRSGATPFMVLLAAFQALLGRVSGKDDLTVGTPVAGRDRVEIESLIGFFVNTLVLRGDLQGDPAFEELVARARETALDAYAHQELPFEKLVEALEPERSLSHSALFQVMFSFQAAWLGPQEAAGEDGAETDTTGTGLAKFDLTLTLDETSHSGTLNYNADLFDRPTAHRLAAAFPRLLRAAVEEPGRRLSELPLLSPAERHQLQTEWNDTALRHPEEGLCLHDLFGRQAARTPDAPAVVFEGNVLTYRELDRRGNRLAHHLAGLGVGPEVKVGLLTYRRPEMVVGLLGILKAGGTYVPLDPGAPRERLEMLLEDTGAPVLLTAGEVPSLPNAVPLDISLDGAWDLLAGPEDAPPAGGAAPENGAYVIYTSGSTGKPKGVVVEHRQILHYLWGIEARADLAGLTGPVRYAMVQPLTVDACKTVVFPSLLRGGVLHLIEEARALDPRGLAAYLKEHAIDLLKAAPSHLAALQSGAATEDLLPRGWLIFGGEASRLDWARDLDRRGGGCRVFNHYGPTETTVGMLAGRVGPEATTGPSLTTPLGRPLAGARIYNVDSRAAGSTLVPIGVPGELWIGGAYVSRGYLGRPDLTADRFLPDPFDPKPGARLYRTGDLVRLLADGRVEFLGRIDHQVKIRGFRIELGEIDAALARHPGVAEGLTAARPDASGALWLVAYVVPRQDMPSTDDLHRFLADRLPEYMVPAAFVTLAELPRTPHGKVDRKRLPEPEAFGEAGTPVEPRTPAEAALAEIWRDLLGAGGTARIGVRDDFFAAGGHSLLAVRLMARIRSRFGRDLPLSVLFQRPTIERLAEVLERREEAEEGRPRRIVVDIQPEGEGTPLFFVHAVGGNVLGYADLARHLGDDRPFLGLQSPDPDAGFPETLEALASLYLQEARAARASKPLGPWRLGGWSMGAHVAWEMARQLRAQGEEVERLTLVDPPPPGLYRPPSSEAELALSFARDLAGVQGLALPPEAELADVPPIEVLPRLFAGVRAAGLLPPEVGYEDVRRLFETFRRNNRMLGEYRPGPYAGSATLVIARASGTEDAVPSWRRLLGGELAVHLLEGDHYSILREPRVADLAAILRR